MNKQTAVIWCFDTIFGVITGTALIFVLTGQSAAQRGSMRGMGFGPGQMTFGLQYDYFDPSGNHQLLGSLSRTMPLGFRPGSSPTSRVMLLTLKGGARFGGNLDSTEFRWRINVLDGNISRKFILIGATLVDLNRSAILEKDYRWVNLRLGINPSLGNHQFSVSPRFFGSAGLGSWELGRINYPDLEIVADTSLSGTELGYQAAVTLRLLGILIITADYKDRTIITGPEPHFKVWGVTTQVWGRKAFGGVVNFFVSYRKEDVDLRDSDLVHKNRHFQIGICYTPLPRRPANPWD